VIDNTNARSNLGQRVLVTGATGFLGSRLCEVLEDMGIEIHGVSRTARLEFGSIRWWKADLTNINSVRALWKEVRPDAVFHLSALSTAAPDVQLVLPTLNSILVSSLNILLVSAEQGCRRVLLPASLTEPAGASEVPTSPYAAAKSAASAYAQMFHALYGVPVVLVRPFMTYGPRQDIHKLVPYVTLSLLNGQSPKISSGKSEADWIYVDDVVDGFVLAAQTPKLEGSAVDLGCGELVSVRDIVTHIVRLTGVGITPTFGAIPERPLERARSADTEGAFSRLGWKPKTALVDGLARTVEWYRQYRTARKDASA
jgi:nucleoside-diphosphate-sugar epimerase